MEYRIISSESERAFVDEITQAVMDGWKTQCGVSVTTWRGEYVREFLYTQLMTRSPTEVKSVERLTVIPGDIVVATVVGVLSDKQRSEAYEYVKRDFPHNKVLIVSDDVQLKVLSKR